MVERLGRHGVGVKHIVVTVNKVVGSQDAITTNVVDEQATGQVKQAATMEINVAIVNSGGAIVHVGHKAVTEDITVALKSHHTQGIRALHRAVVLIIVKSRATSKAHKRPKPSRLASHQIILVHAKGGKLGVV